MLGEQGRPLRERGVAHSGEQWTMKINVERLTALEIQNGIEELGVSKKAV